MAERRRRRTGTVEAGGAGGLFDRVLGSHEPPTSAQRWTARHPLWVGLLVGVPFTLFYWSVSPHSGLGDLLVSALGGAGLGGFFVGVAFLERYRQRRWRRLTASPAVRRRQTGSRPHA
ncbi:hypothetical protein ACMA1D_29860 [Streptomyces sp. 796.1]|uniref:hypothetical protein n=1 Tax=Streptomyces sp. 796.1 TaxID=3163029 RepID=UPI0039C96C53